jgi:L-asparagine transporter-like permease
MKKVGIAASILTLAVMIPILFIMTRSAVSSNQFVVIVSAVLLLVLWIIPYRQSNEKSRERFSVRDDVCLRRRGGLI